MDRKDTLKNIPKPGLSRPTVQEKAQNIHNAKRFLLSRHFMLEQDDVEKLSALFLLEETYSHETYLGGYARALKVPIALQGTALEQAKEWLTSYSPGLWHLIEQGKFSIPDDEPIRHSEKQARFLIELKQFLPWVEIARAFAREFHTDLIKNMASELSRVDHRRSELPIWASYARQSANGILCQKDAVVAEDWRRNYVTGSRSTMMARRADDEDIRDTDRFDQLLFVEEIHQYLSWKMLAPLYCNEFGISETWQGLARKFLRRKIRKDWIEFQRDRELYGLTTWQKCRVKNWLETYISEEIYEKAHLTQQQTRAESVQDGNEFSSSDAFIIHQMETAQAQSKSGKTASSSSQRPHARQPPATDSPKRPSARPRKDDESTAPPEHPQSRRRGSISRYPSSPSYGSPYERTGKCLVKRREQVHGDAPTTAPSEASSSAPSKPSLSADSSSLFYASSTPASSVTSTADNRWSPESRRGGGNNANPIVLDDSDEEEYTNLDMYDSNSSTILLE